LISVFLACFAFPPGRASGRKSQKVKSLTRSAMLRLEPGDYCSMGLNRIGPSATASSMAMEDVMKKAVLLLLLLAPATGATAGEALPKLDVAKTCTAAQKAQDGIPDKYAKCMKDEETAKTTLASAWPAAKASTRDTCEGEAKDGPFPSYADLLTCVQMFESGNPPAKKK
jgi:hypothetical protein